MLCNNQGCCNIHAYFILGGVKPNPHVWTYSYWNTVVFIWNIEIQFRTIYCYVLTSLINPPPHAHWYPLLYWNVWSPLCTPCCRLCRHHLIPHYQARMIVIAPPIARHGRAEVSHSAIRSWFMSWGVKDDGEKNREERGQRKSQGQGQGQGRGGFQLELLFLSLIHGGVSSYSSSSHRSLSLENFIVRSDCLILAVWYLHFKLHLYRVALKTTAFLFIQSIVPLTFWASTRIRPKESENIAMYGVPAGRPIMRERGMTYSMSNVRVSFSGSCWSSCSFWYCLVMVPLRLALELSLFLLLCFTLCCAWPQWSWCWSWSISMSCILLALCTMPAAVWQARSWRWMVRYVLSPVADRTYILYTPLRTVPAAPA